MQFFEIQVVTNLPCFHSPLARWVFSCPKKRPKQNVSVFDFTVTVYAIHFVILQTGYLKSEMLLIDISIFTKYSSIFCSGMGICLKMAWISTKDCVAAVLLCKQQAKEKSDKSWEDAALKLRHLAATGFVVTRPCMQNCRMVAGTLLCCFCGFVRNK